MNNSAAQRLPQAWEAYRSICRDCLEQKRTQGTLSAAAATMAVRTAEHVWYDETSPCGQWLADVAAVERGEGAPVALVGERELERALVALPSRGF